MFSMGTFRWVVGFEDVRGGPGDVDDKSQAVLERRIGVRRLGTPEAHSERSGIPHLTIG